MDQATVSVVVPTKNRPDMLRACITSVVEAAHEVIVVVDNEDDGSYPMLKQMASDGAAVKVLVTNGGRSAARQLGVESATGDLVLLLDDDVIGRPGLVEGHAAAHDGTPLVVLGYMPVLDPASVFSRLYADEYENNCRRYEADGSAVLGALWGGNLSMRRSDALAVGLVSGEFDRRYHEDTDFGFRCTDAGLRGRFDRSIAADHHHSRELPAFLADARSQGEGRVLLLHRYGDRSPFPLSSAIWRALGSSPVFVAVLTTVLAPLTKSSPAAVTTAKLLRRIHRAAGEVAMSRELR